MKDKRRGRAEFVEGVCVRKREKEWSGRAAFYGVTCVRKINEEAERSLMKERMRER